MRLLCLVVMLFASSNLVFGQNPYKTFNATGTGKSPGSSSNVTDGGLTGSVSYSSGIYTWTVPSTGNYQLEVAGAAGGSNIKASRTGGSGAYLKSSLELTAGTQIKIVVGQKGIDNSITSLSYTGGAGGGGIFKTVMVMVCSTVLRLD